MPSEPPSESKSKKQADRNPKDNPTDENRLPFEPKKNRKKPAKKSPATPAEPKDSKAQEQKTAKERSAIPEVVSKRMIRRMGIFCGIPSALGISTFLISYVVVTNAWFKLPNIAVVLCSMGFFGIGVLGLSYGVISASWDEDKPGSMLGWQEFTTNFGRLTEAWRSARQKN